MDQREKILRRVVLKAADFARQISYHRALSNFSNQFHLNFWRYTFGNAIEIAVLDWLHLFGSHTDDLHWKSVVKDIDAFRKGLFVALGVTEKEWLAYRKIVKEYRDKDIAHIEVRPCSIVPDLTMALDAVTYYHQIVYTELSNIGDYSGWPKDLKEYYKKSFDQAREVCSKAFQATKDIKERVY